MCGRKWFSKGKRLYNRLRALFYGCLGDRYRWCYWWRMQEACRRAQTYRIAHFYRVIAISNYPWSFEVLTFLWEFCRASAVLLVQFICNFTEKLKVYISLFCLKSFFFKWITTGGADYQNHKVQCWLKKSKTTLEIRSSHCWKWRNNGGFYRSKGNSFQ